MSYFVTYFHYSKTFFSEMIALLATSPHRRCRVMTSKRGWINIVCSPSCCWKCTFAVPQAAFSTLFISSFTSIYLSFKKKGGTKEVNFCYLKHFLLKRGRGQDITFYRLFIRHKVKTPCLNECTHLVTNTSRVNIKGRLRYFLSRKPKMSK